MNYISIKNYDIANGPGVRVSLFVSGCNHHCKGCFNPESWDFSAGKNFGDEEIDLIIDYLKDDYIKGLTVLGGEPMDEKNQSGVLKLVKKVKSVYPNKSIWLYTGYLFDKDILDNMCKNLTYTRELLSYLDVIVDGEFILSEKDLSIIFRGSRNQRIIDVQASLKNNRVVLHEKHFIRRGGKVL